MAGKLDGVRVAILAADGVERVELEQPRDALEGAGANIHLLSLHDGQIQARNNDLDPAGTFPVDGLVAGASVADYDTLLLPGGKAKPSWIVSHELPLDQAPEGYEHFDNRDQGWTKVVLHPTGTPARL